MYGFRGMLDGEMITDAVEFVVKARTSEEIVPKEAIGSIMVMLSESQLENNKFTKKEISMVDGYEVINDVKPTYYVRKEVEEGYDDYDGFDDDDEFESLLDYLDEEEDGCLEVECPCGCGAILTICD